MNQYLTRVTFFIVLAVTFMLIVALFTKPDGDKLFNGFEMGVAVVIAFVGLFYSLQSTAYGDILPLWFFYINEDLLVLILGLVALVAIIMIPIASIAAKSLGKRVGKVSTQAMEKAGTLTSYLIELFKMLPLALTA